MNLNVRGGAGDITKADVNVKPQDNLYLAVNSEWLSKAKISPDRSSTGAFEQIDVELEKQLMSDFAEFASGKELPNVPNFAKSIELYKLAKDFDKRNADGAAPIKEDLDKLLALTDYKDFQAQLSDLYKAGYPLPLTLYVDANMKNTDIHSVYIGGTGTILPDTTTYESDRAKPLLEIYQKQAESLLKLAGVDEAKAAKLVELALAYDRRVSKVAKSSEEWADYPAMFNPVKTSEFAAKVKNLDFEKLLKDLFKEAPDEVINTEPRYHEHMDEMFNEEVYPEIQAWMIVKFVSGRAGYLSQAFREASFPFSQALTGQKELVSQEKHAYHLADGTFSEVDGVYYGQTYFGKEAKEDVISMIKKMLDVYEERIKNNSWLSQATKEKAITKLRALILKVGYPDKIEEKYYRYDIDPALSLYENMKSVSQVNIAYNLERLTKPVDRTIWLMPGNLINACYDPSRNDLTFPAAILQAPFYDLKQDPAENFGGIGVVIAHEISHAFDNNGAKFDEKGNMVNWWTDQDFAEFNKRTQQEIDLFDGIQYGPVKLNGKQVVSENIADQGGLTAAVEAAKGDKLDMKKLFENFARVWAIKQHPELIETVLSMDVHSPGPLRANVQSQCQEEFYKAFDVKPGDGMYLEPEKRVTIW